jgi:WD40 repeat protein
MTDPMGEREWSLKAFRRGPLAGAMLGFLLSSCSWTENAQVDALAWSPDGKVLASGGGGRTQNNFILGGWWVNYGDVLLRNPESGQDLRRLSGHDHPVKSVAYGPDKKLLFSGSFDGSTRVWDPASGELRGTIREGEPKQMVGGGHVALDPQGMWLATSNSWFWDTPSAQAAGWSSIALFRAQTGKLECRLSGHTRAIQSLAFSPDAKTLVSGSLDRTLRTWSIPEGKPLLTLTGHRGPVYSVAWSPDARLIASASGDRTITLWDAQSGAEKVTLVGHSGPVASVQFSPDGTVVASGGGDRSVRLWDPNSGRELRSLSGHVGVVLAVAWSPDGTRIASAGGVGDNSVRIWDASTGKQLRVLHGH